MQYELYVDSLFFLNFGMNLYLLILVNISTLRTASPLRLILGAVWGSLGFLLLFADAIPAAVRLLTGIFGGTAGMLLIAFPVAGVRMFWKLFQRLLVYSFCMGGLLFCLTGLLADAGLRISAVWEILAAGGILFLFLQKTFQKRERSQDFCLATLRRGENSITVDALVDSGNSLIEPVTGKPVSVVEREVFGALWHGSAQGFRAIPYHSVGKEHGIMNGYLLPELLLEVDGVKKEFRDVYIAVNPKEGRPERDGEDRDVKMIINPGLFDGEGKGRPRRRPGEKKHDIESGDTGKDAV
jgi:sigma-E processing peptidase SpoIIGA